MITSISRTEFYHVAIGLIGLLVWLFGQKFGLPVDAITFAQTVTISVVGHAVGLNSLKPDIPAQTPKATP